MGFLEYNEKRFPSYSDVQRATVAVLGMLGLKLALNRRLSCFRLLVKIDREFPSHPAAGEAKKLLTRLVELRKQGKEPPHKNGVYV